MKLKPKHLAPFINKSLKISELSDEQLNMFTEFRFISDGKNKYSLEEIRKRNYLILDTEDLMLLYNLSGFPIISFKEVLRSIIKIKNKLR